MPRSFAVWVLVRWIAGALASMPGARAAERAGITPQILPLPPLVIAGRPATAHTQGLEIVAGQYYVTARREDTHPQQALLLRTGPGKRTWETWDITPRGSGEATVTLDHPGGFQSDGRRLWIPVAESRRNGRSVIRVYPLAKLHPGVPLEPEMEFPVNDHIGAIAVSARADLVLGASWDTEKVYVWNLRGVWQPTLTGGELQVRGLGAVSAVAGGAGRAGVTVQDWKWVGNRLYAGGLFKTPGQPTEPPASRWVRFSDFLGAQVQSQAISIPRVADMELAREAMAVSGRWGYFLPADLGSTNRLYRVAANAWR